MIDEEEKRPLKPANENIYYCLATLYGEPEPGQQFGELMDRNRKEWQRWLDNGPDRGEVATDDLDHMAARAVQGNLTALLQSRMRNDSAELPNPTDRVDFADTLFDRKLFLGAYRFPAGARFDNSLLAKGIDATNAAFNNELSFVSANIKVRGEFGKATLEYVNFDDAQVEGQLGFGGDIARDFTMRDCRVDGALVFRRMGFKGDVNFVAARLGSVKFFNSTFHEMAEFSHALISGEARFDNAKFESAAVFKEVRFHGRTEFRGANFKGPVWFDDSEWRDLVSFINAKFEAGATFHGAVFELYAPDFRGAQLHEAIELHDARWPAKPKSEHAQRANLYAYERLKQEMERQKKHVDEQCFFSREMRVRRALMKPGLEWVLNLGYEILSDYGRSVARPVIGLACLGFAGFMLLWLLPVSVKVPLSLFSAAQLSLFNLVVFLPMRGEVVNALVANGVQFNWIFRIVSAGEALGGTVLLFLLALALKNRFRMR